MEQKFIETLAAAREKAAGLGIRIRPVTTVQDAKRALSGTRVSDGFWQLSDKKRLDLSLEALAVDKRFTSLFTDEEANTALTRLLEAGYYLF